MHWSYVFLALTYWYHLPLCVLLHPPACVWGLAHDIWWSLVALLICIHPKAEFLYVSKQWVGQLANNWGMLHMLFPFDWNVGKTGLESNFLQLVAILIHVVDPWPFIMKGYCHYCLSVCPSVCLSLYLSIHLWTLPCLHNNSSQLWAAITTCAPDMHHGILWAGIKNGGHQSWPSCSFWPFCLRILGNLACLHHNW